MPGVRDIHKWRQLAIIFYLRVAILSLPPTRELGHIPYDPIDSELTTEIVVFKWAIEKGFFIGIIVHNEATNEFRLIRDICPNKPPRESNLTILIEIDCSTLGFHPICYDNLELNCKKVQVHIPLATIFTGMCKPRDKSSINTINLCGVYIKTLTNR